MALNKFMHPRNHYKEKKPDFKALAVKYPEFRKYATQDIKGAVHIGLLLLYCTFRFFTSYSFDFNITQ